MARYTDTNPYNIEAPQSLYTQYSPEVPTSLFANGNYPSGEESDWIWENQYIPIEHTVNGVTVDAHKYIRLKTGINGKWTAPIRLGGADGATGEKGDAGVNGTNGTSGTIGSNGTNGADGVDVVSATINADGYLILTLSDATTVNAGIAKGDTGEAFAIDGSITDWLTFTDPNTATPTHPYFYTVATTGTDYDGRTITDLNGDPVVATNLNGHLMFINNTTGDWVDYGVFSGVPGSQGIQGNQGWSPILATETVNATTEVIKVTDWTGGGGSKPAVPNPPYIGTTGFVVVGSATNIKGSATTAAHNSLTSIQGGSAGDYYHLTGTQATDLTNGGTTILHTHTKHVSIGIVEDTTSVPVSPNGYEFPNVKLNIPSELEGWRILANSVRVSFQTAGTTSSGTSTSTIEVCCRQGISRTQIMTFAYDVSLGAGSSQTCTHSVSSPILSNSVLIFRLYSSSNAGNITALPKGLHISFTLENQNT